MFIMKKMLLTFCGLLLLASCTKEGDTIYVERDAPTLSLKQIRSDLIIMEAKDKDVSFKWPHLKDGDKMNVIVMCEGQKWSEQTYDSSITSFLQRNVETNKHFSYIFRVTDGTSFSDGIIKSFIREGASAVTDLAVCQQEGASGYEALLTWTPVDDADEIVISATDGSKTEEFAIKGKAHECVFPGIAEGETWNFAVTARNSQGEALPVATSLKVGKTAVAFLSYYATPEALVAEGDDDEASAWLWFHEQYPNSRFLYFGDIKSADDLKNFRVLFYIRDLDTGTENDVWEQPQVVKDATPTIIQWYKEGGNLLLWQHACTYIGDLGRIDKSLLKSKPHTIGISYGNMNGGYWYMAAYTNMAGRYYINYTSHPIYNNVGVNTDNSITVKGSCWTEDHNCCFNDIPAALTGMNDQSADTYTVLTEVYGIYPLATWDNSGMNERLKQLNVWEARQGNTDYKGTVLCMGNGGLEFSYKNADGSADKSARPSNNTYHGNVLQIAKNAIEYLKTR